MIIENLFKELNEQLRSIQEKLVGLESSLNYSTKDIITIDKNNLGEILVINEDRGYIIFKYKECSFVEKINSTLHKGLIEGNLEFIILKKMEKPSKWNYSYLVNYFAINPTQAAIIKNYKA